MPTSKNLNNFVINKVESQAVFDEMKRRGMIEADETYWVLGGQELPEVTASDNGKVATVTNGSWSAENLPTASTTVAGVIKVGDGLSVTDGVLSATGGESFNVLFTLTGTTVTSTKTPSELATNFKAGSGVSAILNTTSTGDYESLYKITCNNTAITFATITGNTLGGGFIYKQVIGNISTGVWRYENAIG